MDIFDSSTVRKFFIETLENIILPKDKKRFVSLVKEEFWDKSFSEETLDTYKLTVEDIRNVAEKMDIFF